MAEIPIFQINVYTSEVYTGNPAAVCPLPEFLDDDLLQAVARENNLAETAFIVPSRKPGVDFDLRWFTPNNEVELCGHATVAAAYIVLTFLEPDWSKVTFSSATGTYTITQKGGLFSLTLPTRKAERVEEPEGLCAALGNIPIEEVYFTGDLYHLVYKDRAAVEALKPDFSLLKASQAYGFITSAKNKDDELGDYVSRCFYPSLDIEEDPVTLTSYLISAPYWAKRLDRSGLIAHQISRRGGQIWLKLTGGKVTLSGEAVLVSQGSLYITGIPQSE